MEKVRQIILVNCFAVITHKHMHTAYMHTAFRSHSTANTGIKNILVHVSTELLARNSLR